MILLVVNNLAVGFNSITILIIEYVTSHHSQQENRFTKCTDCTRYKEAKEKTHDKKATKYIDKLLADHMDLVW